MSQTRENTINFDSTALAGLRGISALHIVLFHSLTYCLFEFNVYAQVSQQLQYLQSIYDIKCQSPLSYESFMTILLFKVMLYQNLAII